MKKLPFKPWYLVINNQKIVKHHQRAIRVAMSGLASQQYWKEKMPSVSQIQRDLDTTAMERAMSDSTPG